MNQMTPSAGLASPSWQPDPTGISRERRKSLPVRGFGGVYGERAAPRVNPGRRLVSVAAAIGIQAALVALILAAGVELPTKAGPLMVVNIASPEIKSEELPPPRPTLVQPQVAITLPFMPDVIQDAPPPPQQVTTAISIAPKGAEPAPPVYKAEKYETVMLRHINAALRYPTVARQRHQQGTVYVRFVMDRHGNVLSSQVERSSRFPSLDEEGLALLARAAPLPAPPADVAGDRIQLVVPIVFSLRN